MPISKLHRALPSYHQSAASDFSAQMHFGTRSLWPLFLHIFPRKQRIFVASMYHKRPKITVTTEARNLIYKKSDILLCVALRH
jgi:hypothetical protein